MLSESSFIESSIFDLESGFSIVESGFLKRESEHEPGFFPSPGFLRVRVQVRVRVRSGFRSMPIRLENLLRMLSESSFIESSIFDLESAFSIVESGFLKRESEHESGFFPSPGFLRVRVQVRVRVRSGFRSMPFH